MAMLEMDSGFEPRARRRSFYAPTAESRPEPEPATQVWEQPSTPEPSAGMPGYQTQPPPAERPYQHDWSYQGSPAYTPPAPNYQPPRPAPTPPQLQQQFNQVASQVAPTPQGYQQLLQNDAFRQTGLQSVGNGLMRTPTGQMVQALQGFPGGNQAWSWGAPPEQPQRLQLPMPPQAPTNPWALLTQRLQASQAPPQAPPMQAQGSPWGQLIQGALGPVGAPTAPSSWMGGSPSFNERTGEYGGPYQGGGVKNLPGPTMTAPAVNPQVGWGGPQLQQLLQLLGGLPAPQNYGW